MVPASAFSLPSARYAHDRTHVAMNIRPTPLPGPTTPANPTLYLLTPNNTCQAYWGIVVICICLSC